MGDRWRRCPRVSGLLYRQNGQAIRSPQWERCSGSAAPQINADLTGGIVDLTEAREEERNRRTAFRGGYKRGSFDISGDLAREWLCLPANPNGRPNADVLKPWINGIDVTRRPAGKWVIDFGHEMSEADAALYEAPVAYVQKHVKPERDINRRADLQKNWWRHDRSGQAMFRKILTVSRYIVTPMTAKYRLFAWRDPAIYPENVLVVIARDDDTTFGILHSRFHEAWALWLGTSLEDGIVKLTKSSSIDPQDIGLQPVSSPLC